MQHQPLKDYYRLLGITEKATPEEIKTAYRQLAFASHPDRNPENREAAENRFKEITEAYGILIDPQKRSRYDQLRDQGFDFQQAHSQRNTFSRDQVLRDLLNNPYARNIFKDLEQEFLRKGFRFDSNFIHKTLFGGKGLFIGGIFFVTLLGNRGLFRGESQGPQADFRKQFPSRERTPLLRKIGEKAGLLPGKTAPSAQERPRGRDQVYELAITQEQANHGDRIAVQLTRKKQPYKLWVTIPPGIRSGTKLRLAGKGKPGRLGSPPGDLYIKVFVQK